jgi:hypothetical protein
MFSFPNLPGFAYVGARRARLLSAIVAAVHSTPAVRLKMTPDRSRNGASDGNQV